ncbi:MAG: DUF2815 family protein [Burkholderiaceae bacterium]|nr:DUF2815 family protein [Burkholderiaceae bacterium]
MDMTITNARLSFPHLFEPAAESNQPNAKMVYSASFLLKKDDPTINKIREAIYKTAEEKWGEKANGILMKLYANNLVCLRDGDLKDYDGYEGCMFIASKNKNRPLLIDRDRSILGQSDGKPYAGCYVNAKVSFWAQDNQYGKRINCSLLGVQFVKHGDSFTGARVAVTDDFEDLGVNADDEVNNLF